LRIILVFDWESIWVIFDTARKTECGYGSVGVEPALHHGQFLIQAFLELVPPLIFELFVTFVNNRAAASFALPKVFAPAFDFHKIMPASFDCPLQLGYIVEHFSFGPMFTEKFHLAIAYFGRAWGDSFGFGAQLDRNSLHPLGVTEVC
jgi:hypothetical protein